jgi:tetratricopeptide (TPR) repeat protein
MGVGLNADGSRLATVIDSKETTRAEFGADKVMVSELTVWEVDSGRELAKHSLVNRVLKPLREVRFSADSALLAIVWQNALEVRELASASVLHTVKGLTGMVAFGPGNTRWAGANRDVVKVWDTATGHEQSATDVHGVLRESPAFVEQADGKLSRRDQSPMAFDSTGHLLAIAKWRDVQVLDLMKRQRLLSLRGHTDDVRCMAFSSDSRRLVTASYDKSVKIWDLATGQELRSIKADVHRLAFHPDGYRVLATTPTEVQVWDGRPPTPELQTEREAVGLLDNLFAKPLLKAEVLARVRGSQSIADEVRQQALALAESYRDDPDRFNQASWQIICQPTAPQDKYVVALGHAQTACRLDPENGNYLNTMGAGQYRLGNYQDALATLTQADQLRKGTSPFDASFLAMILARLGRKDEAQAALDRLRSLLEKDEWAKNAEAQALLREVEETVKK